MVKYTQTIRRQIADELFECVCRFVGLALKGLLHNCLCGILADSNYFYTGINTVREFSRSEPCTQFVKAYKCFFCSNSGQWIPAGDLQFREYVLFLPYGNKACRLSSVNHSAKTVYQCWILLISQ